MSFTSSSSSSDNGAEEVNNMIINALTFHVPRLLSPPMSRRSNTNAEREYHERGREEGHQRLFNDYFSDHPTYGHMFRRRFRMRKHVFLRIVEALEAHDIFFTQRRDATGRFGLSALQKCTAAIRMIGYGISADAVDEYLRLSESTARLSLEKFTEGIIAQFGEQYLRKPTPADLSKLLQVGQSRGFPGMIGSIDCMHWEWKNCPTARKGQYQGRSGKVTLVLEAVASQDLWIWHAFFGCKGSCNDLNVLYQSPVFDDVLNGLAPPVNFMVNGNQYNMGYYLTDGIYPPWSAFIPSIPVPVTRKHKLFSQRQEAARKDVERAFGVLQSRFRIIRHPSLAWDEAILHKIMMACIIMHNMIVEDECDTYANYHDPKEYDEDLPRRRGNRRTSRIVDPDPNFQFSTDRIVDINQYLSNRRDLRDRQKHASLKSDLVENIWQRFGEADD